MEDLVKESSFPTGNLVTKSLLSRATLLAKEVFRAKSKAQSAGSQSSAGSTQQQVQQPDISAVSAHVSLMGSEVSAMVLANGLGPLFVSPVKMLADASIDNLPVSLVPDTSLFQLLESERKSAASAVPPRVAFTY